MKNILLSNDDGIHSKGIWALRDELQDHFQVFIVAPDRERSAAGHSISLRDPIRLKVIEPGLVFSVDGTPVDAVHVALLGVVKAPIDFIVTGINYGLNLGTDVFYSGTVSAAFQAASFDIPAMAVSIDLQGEELHYKTAARFARLIIDRIERGGGLERNVILNVNVPNLPAEEIKGVEVTRLGQRHYKDRLIEREDPKKNKYFWIEGEHTHDVLEEGTDVKAIHDRKISVTPLRLDITAADYIGKLRQWEFHKISQ